MQDVMLKVLEKCAQGVKWTIQEEARVGHEGHSYAELHPEAAFWYWNVHTVGILYYGPGSPHSGQACVNWHEGGTCPTCGRNDFTCPGHREDGSWYFWTTPDQMFLELLILLFKD